MPLDLRQAALRAGLREAARNERGQQVVGYGAMVSPGMMAVLARVIGRIEEQGAST
jgi:carbon starvation protein CstA